jgi:hypothetical protein
MPRDCNLCPFAVFNSGASLSLSRSTFFRSTAPRERSVSKPSQSCRSSVLQSKICGGAQSRARDVVSAICTTPTNTHFHASVTHNLAVEPAPTSVAFRRRPIDDRCRVALSADQSFLIPPPHDVQSTRNTYRVHHHTQTLGSSSTTSSSLPAHPLCNAATHPRVVRQLRDDRSMQYKGATQSNGAAQKIDQQVHAEGHSLRSTQRWTEGEITAFAPPSPGHCIIKRVRCSVRDFDGALAFRRHVDRSRLYKGTTFLARRLCWLRCGPKR